MPIHAWTGGLRADYFRTIGRTVGVLTVTGKNPGKDSSQLHASLGSDLRSCIYLRSDLW